MSEGHRNVNRDSLSKARLKTLGTYDLTLIDKGAQTWFLLLGQWLPVSAFLAATHNDSNNTVSGADLLKGPRNWSKISAYDELTIEGSLTWEPDCSPKRLILVGNYTWDNKNPVF